MKSLHCNECHKDNKLTQKRQYVECVLKVTNESIFKAAIDAVLVSLLLT